MRRLLILGGTTEASLLARTLAHRTDCAPLLSFAGRTEAPRLPAIPHRIGGFGGIEGLTAFLRAEAIDAVVDATHPFAARMSANAVAACRIAGVPLAAYTRPPWSPLAGDDWRHVPDIGGALRMLHEVGRSGANTTNTAVQSRETGGADLDHGPARDTRVCGPTRAEVRPGEARNAATSSAEPLRVFLTTGRLDLARFRRVPQHRYLIRTIDPPEPAELPPNAALVLARPPFTVESEMALMGEHGIELLVTKNSGGAASVAKLAAARALSIPVLMIDRPPSAGAPAFQALGEILAWIDAVA